MRIPNKNQTLFLLILFVAFTVMGVGFYMLTLPDIARFRQWPYYMLPRGEVLIATATLLALFCKQAALYILWLSNKVYRVVAALSVIALIGVDGLLHVFSIPHVEGWWLPLASSLIAASGISAWIEKYRKGRSDK